MHAVTTHLIAWAPSGYNNFPPGYVAGYETFLNDLAASLGDSQNISSVIRQYPDASGPALTALSNDVVDNYDDTDPYPTSDTCSVSGASACLSGQNIIDEVASIIGSSSTDLNQSYIVLLPPNVDTCYYAGAGDPDGANSCAQSDFCGYHAAIAGNAQDTTFTLIPYTGDNFSNGHGHSCAYPDYPTGSNEYLMSADSVGAHELFESATDPTPDTGYIDLSGAEVADECAWTYGTTASYNQMLNNHEYLLQQMWSNQDNSCVTSDSATATATITPSGDAVVNQPTDFSVSTTGIATASTYAWSYLAPGSTIPTSVGADPSEQITFATPGVYQVWAQVADSSADSVTGVRNVTVYGLPTAGFAFSTQAPTEAVGVPVSFNSASTSGFGSPSITSASWNFGDGSSGSGNSVSHTYAAAGTYTVTLSVAQTHGETDSVSHSVTVSNAPTAAFAVPGGVTAGTAATFSSGSTAGAGALTDVTWNFGDGWSSSGSPVSHTYASAGTYTVTLTVKQADGLSASVHHTVTVAASGSSDSSGLSASNVANAARRLLRAALTPSSKATNIARLLKTGGATIVISAPNESGRITISWRVTIHHKKVVVARGSRRVIAGSRARVVVRLTAAGRRLLRKSRTLKVTASGLYRYGSSGVIVNRNITLHH